jgi:hypothetical protein
MMRRIPDPCTLALTAPVLLAMLWLGSVVALERAGSTLSSGIVPRNSAEAAGLGLASELLRFLRQGEDPHHVYDVRAEILSSAVLRATTLEAAMWARQLELIELLDREGAIADAQERAALACLAADLDIDEVAEYLGAQNGTRCEPGQALERVTARTHHAVEERLP